MDQNNTITILMENKKQTSVDWLKEMLIDNKYLSKDAEHLFEEARAMGKEQMGDAYYDGKNNGMDICNPLSRAKGISFEQYYNETYNNDRSNSSTVAS